MKIDEKVKNKNSNFLGDFKGVDKTINCKHCNYLQYATNDRCLNCNEKIASEFIEMNYSDENKLFLSPFSFNGRIRRQEYILSLILVMAYLFLIVFVLKKVFHLDSILGIIFLPAVWFRIAQGAKRSHDIGYSGWFQIIPLYGLFMLFVDGEEFENKYGKNPKGISLIFKN